MLKIKQKLQSERGASITFALLLFLVCAVTGSLILMASTASAGRMSRTAKMDQQYYSVTSAAGLLQEAVEKESVKVEQTTETTTVTKSTGEEIPEESGTEKSSVFINGEKVVTGYSTDSLTEDAAKRLFEDPLTSSSFTRKMTLSSSDDALSGLTVAVTETLLPDGTLQLDITGQNADAADGGASDTAGAYRIRMVFDLAVQQSTDRQKSQPVIQNAAGDYYETVTTLTETKTAVYSWTLSDLSTFTGE